MMPSALRVIGIIAMVSVLNSHPAMGSQRHCNDVASIDFKNMSIEISSRGIVQFDQGIGFSSDGGDGRIIHDWKLTLVQDEILRPEKSTILRLIRINASHVTGSGAWDHVFVYQCRDGNLTRIFEESFLYGVEIQRISDVELVFVHAGKKRIVYKWDSKRKIYDMVSN